MKREPFVYHCGGSTYRGLLVDDPARTSPRPGILVVHEAWGLGDQVKERAERLAEMGYVALAVDMFGEGKQAASTEEGMGWTTELRANVPELRARIRAAFDALAARPEVDPRSMAAIGYCFGGTTALELARGGAPVRGVVSFHGGLATQRPSERGAVSAKILVCTGSEDPFIPAAQVHTFIEEMTHAHADFQVIIYGGAEHGFTNRHAGDRGVKGLAYNQAADERSWNAMHSFFHEIFN